MGDSNSQKLSGSRPSSNVLRGLQAVASKGIVFKRRQECFAEGNQGVLDEATND
jgi:hypothetical protein